MELRINRVRINRARPVTKLHIELQMFVLNLLISMEDNYSNKFNNNVLMLKTSYEERRVVRDNKQSKKLVHI